MTGTLPSLFRPSIGGGAARVSRAIVALTAVVFLADAVISIWSGRYLNLGSGVWLGLARDLRDGLFYRPIFDGTSYGGTRYFPMLFVPIGLLARAGLPIVPAGLAISIGGVLFAAAAVFVFLRRWGVAPPLAAIGGALTVAPYFVHETAFAIRCEPLAAAFAISGLAVLGRDGREHSPRRLAAAAALFVCAFATKITCVYGPAAATAGLFLARRRGAALALAGCTVAGAAAFLLTLHVATAGRALDSFRACALAGASLGSLVSADAVLRPISLILGSHVLTAVFALALVALLMSPRRLLELPSLQLLAALAITGVIFTSPGTIITSQIVDAYVAAVVVIVIAVDRSSGALRQGGMASLALLTLWTAAQNGGRMLDMARHDLPTANAGRRALAQALDSCHGSLVAESAMVPLAAGLRPVLLDPFAFHVVGLNRPAVGEALVRQIDARRFTCVVLEQDPTSDKGRAWYRNVNLSAGVADAVVDHYRLDRIVAGERFYRADQ